MTGWSRVRRASPVTFFIHVVVTLCAVPFAALTSGALSEATADQLRGVDAVSEPGGAVLLEAAERTMTSAGLWLFLALAGGMAVAVLLGPLLSVAWTAALHQPRSIGAALRAGLRMYPRSVLLSLISGLCLAVALPLSLLTLLLHFPLRDLADERIHDAAMLGCLLVPVAVLALWASATDLARAGLGAGAPGLGAALAAALRGLRLRVVGAYAGLAAVQVGLGVAGAALGGLLDGPGLGPAAAVLAAGQGAALARTFVRSRWLARAVAEVEPEVERLRAAAEAARQAAAEAARAPVGIGVPGVESGPPLPPRPFGGGGDTPGPDGGSEPG